MSAYASFFKEMESLDELGPAELQALKDFFSGKLSSKEAARQYTKNLDIQDETSRQILSVLTTLPIRIGGTSLQVNVTKLLSEIINLWDGGTFGDVQFVIRGCYDSNHFHIYLGTFNRS